MLDFTRIRHEVDTLETLLLGGGLPDPALIDRQKAYIVAHLLGVTDWADPTPTTVPPPQPTPIPTPGGTP